VKEIVFCPICGADNDVYYTGKDIHNTEVSVSICPNDGLVYINPRMTKEAYSEFYTNQYNKTLRNIKNSKPAPNQPAINTVWDRLKQLDLSKVKTVLDLGAGNGSLIVRLVDELNPVEAHAIEQSEDAIRILSGFQISAVQADLSSDWHLGYKDKIDLVVLRHTLEHVLDPIDILSKIKTVLTIDGIAFIEVPNIMQPLGNKRYYFIVLHPWHFCCETLDYFTKLSGLDPISTEASKNGYAVYTFCKKGVPANPTKPNVFDKQLKILQKC